MISRHDPGTHRVTITDVQPGVPLLALDGHEIRGCTKAVLALDPEGVPLLKLSLMVCEPLDVSAEAVVVLDKPTRRALQAMGWTPPGNDVPGPA